MYLMKPELCLHVETYVEETPHMRQSAHDSLLLLAIQRSEGVTHDSVLLLAKSELKALQRMLMMPKMLRLRMMMLTTRWRAM